MPLREPIVQLLLRNLQRSTKPNSNMDLQFTPFPELTTDRLLLRRIGPDDSKELFIWRSDERIMRYLDRPRAKSIEDAYAHLRLIDDDINANIGITWGIMIKGGSHLIGNIGFWKITKEHYRAELGYLLHPDYQKQGIMAEALLKVLDYGFKTMKLHSVEANVNPENAGSINLLEKSGFVREAYFRENYYYDGKFLDSAIYSLLTNR